MLCWLYTCHILLGIWTSEGSLTWVLICHMIHFLVPTWTFKQHAHSYPHEVSFLGDILSVHDLCLDYCVWPRLFLDHVCTVFTLWICLPVCALFWFHALFLNLCFVLLTMFLPVDSAAKKFCWWILQTTPLVLHYNTDVIINYSVTIKSMKYLIRIYTYIGVEYQ